MSINKPEVPKQYDMGRHLDAWLQEKRSAKVKGRKRLFKKPTPQVRAMSAWVEYAAKMPSAPLRIYESEARVLLKALGLWKLWGVNKVELEFHELPALKYHGREVSYFVDEVNSYG